MPLPPSLSLFLSLFLCFCWKYFKNSDILNSWAKQWFNNISKALHINIALLVWSIFNWRNAISSWKFHLGVLNVHIIVYEEVYFGLLIFNGFNCPYTIFECFIFIYIHIYEFIHISLDIFYNWMDLIHDNYKLKAIYNIDWQLKFFVFS